MATTVAIHKSACRQFTLLILLCLFTAGCASGPMVKMRKQPFNPLAERLKLASRKGPRASGRTRQLLRNHDLPEELGHNPQPLLQSVSQLHRQTPSRESAFALAELSYIAAKKAELTRPQAAMEMYFKSLASSYAFLFDSRFGADHNRYDPRFRNACNLYNSSLESCLRIARKRGRLHPGQTFDFTVAGQHIKVSIETRTKNWQPEDIDSFEFVSDYDIEGLTNLYRTYGLGVPLIAVRKHGSAPPEIEKHYAPGLSFPVTAFLRLDPVSSGHGDATTMHLELHDPLEATNVEIAGRRVPLESDITTPLAFFLDRPEFRYLDTFGLLRPDIAERVAGLYMLQPYQPGKIPVVMVHGLWSSPMTWMEAMNDLQSVPEIRDNYQFWFYLYPTGEPFSDAAVRMRRDLAAVDRVFGEGDRGSALRNKVLVGHSMGGLLSKLMTLESGEQFWNGISQTPLASIKAPPKAKQQLQQVYYFEPNRSIGRIITIAAPFRGSNFANNITRWFAKQWITLPRRTVDATKHLLLQNPNLESVAGRTSIDSLSPDSPFLQVMQNIPPPPNVPQHNVVGAIRNVSLEENTDGIVPYPSAHRDDVASEILVEAGHSEIQRHPRTILEIRRVLLQHLDDYNQGSATGIVPLGGEAESLWPPHDYRMPTDHGQAPMTPAVTSPEVWPRLDLREAPVVSSPELRKDARPVRPAGSQHHRGWTPATRAR